MAKKSKTQSAKPATAADPDRTPKAVDDDVEDGGAAVQPTRRSSLLGSTRSKVFLVVIIGVISVAGVGAYLHSQSSGFEPSQIVRAPDADSTLGGQVQRASEVYQESMRLSNEQQADSAEQTGQSFIPSVEELPEDIDDGQMDEAELDQDGDNGVERDRMTAVEPTRMPNTRLMGATPAAQAPTSEEPEDEPDEPQQTTPQAEPEENPYLSAIQQQMEAATTAWTPRQPRGEVLMAAPVEEAPGAGQSNDGQPDGGANAGNSNIGNPGSGGTSSANSAEAGELFLPPGTVAYAETLNTVTSESTAPVFARIVAGPLNGARLTGQFQPVFDGDGLSIQFNTLAMPDGETASISAYAIDGITANDLIASEVDRRYFQRYGPGLALSFVAGLTEALSTVASETIGIGQDAGIAQAAPTLGQAVAGGVAEASRSIQGNIAENTPQNALITLRSGHPVAILFMDGVAIAADDADGAARSVDRPRSSAASPERSPASVEPRTTGRIVEQRAPATTAPAPTSTGVADPITPRPPQAGAESFGAPRSLLPEEQ